MNPSSCSPLTEALRSVLSSLSTTLGSLDGTLSLVAVGVEGLTQRPELGLAPLLQARVVVLG
jgi:hypothetical protein